MLSVLLQGEGGGGGGGGSHGGSFSHGGTAGSTSCSTTCAIVLGSVFGGLGLCIALVIGIVIWQETRKPGRMDSYKQKSTLSADIKPVDRANLYLSANAQATRTLTVGCTTSYRGHTVNNRAERQAAFDVTFDNDTTTRTISASGNDSWSHFDVCGSFVLDSATHGHVEFVKSYARYTVQYAGDFDATQQPLVVRGSWYTSAGTGDGGPFTMTFSQPLTIIDTAPTAAVVVDINAADDHTQPPQLAAEATAGGYASTLQPPPPYEYQPSEPRSSTESATHVSDVEMASAANRSVDWR